MKYKVGKWYGWNGGECPVHPKTQVEVVFVDGLAEYDGDNNVASFWEWDSKFEPIIAFKILEEYKEPREFWVAFDKDGYKSIWDEEPTGWKNRIKVREIDE